MANFCSFWTVRKTEIVNDGSWVMMYSSVRFVMVNNSRDLSTSHVDMPEHIYNTLNVLIAACANNSFVEFLLKIK